MLVGPHRPRGGGAGVCGGEGVGMNLTAIRNSANNASIAAQSAVWVDLQHEQERSSAHLKRFFCAHNLSMVGCVRASSDAAALLPAKVNLAQPATLLLLDLNDGGSSQQQEIIIMSALFVLKDGISDKECREQIRIYAFQAHALTQLINDAVDNCQVGDVSPDIKDHLGWAFWALSDVLRAQIALCERVSGGQQ